MKITNNNPSSPIEFLYDGFIFMLKIKNRKIINWPDCAGSVGQLLRIYNREENLLLEKKINEDLLKDPIPQETIDTILKVLPSREYLISKQSFSEYYVVSNIVSTEQELFATGYYPFHDDIFMFTQPKSTINPERVEYYKTLIKSGARPKVVTFHIDFPNEYGVYDETPYFIIDGHHKALAYESLKMNIEVLNFESESFFKDRMDDKNRLLLLDLIDVLDLDSIIHIMKNNPRIYHDDSENGKKYNRYFDSMLGQSKQFYGTLLQYLEK